MTGEDPSRHGCLMYGLFHLAIVAVCLKFKAFRGIFPAGPFFHGLQAFLILASFPL